MLRIFVGVVLGTLGAWFLLPRVLAEVFLTFLILAAAVIGIYWVCAGSSVNEIVEGIGIFTLLASVLGCIRLRVEKVSDKLVALLPPLFDTKSKRPQSVERLPAPVFAVKTARINEVEPFFPAAGDPQRSGRIVGLSLLLFSSCVLVTA
jgi:hypothetical protein